MLDQIQNHPIYLSSVWVVSLNSSVGKVLCANSVLFLGHEFESRCLQGQDESKVQDKRGKNLLSHGNEA